MMCWWIEPGRKHWEIRAVLLIGEPNLVRIGVLLVDENALMVVAWRVLRVYLAQDNAPEATG